MKIFISYRRADSQMITDRICDRLEKAFGKENVFQDVLDIKYGLDFRKVLQRQVANSDVLLVVIGPTWATIKGVNEDTGVETDQPRLWNEDDAVRIEVESGLSNQDTTLVIPVLVNNASIPSKKKLPESLQPLVFLNGIQVRNNPYFDEDILRLIKRLQEYDRDRKRQTPSRRAVPIWMVGVLMAVVVVAAIVVMQLAGNSIFNIGVVPTATASPPPTELPTAITPSATPADLSVIRLTVWSPVDTEILVDDAFVMKVDRGATGFDYRGTNVPVHGGSQITFKSSGFEIRAPVSRFWTETGNQVDIHIGTGSFADVFITEEQLRAGMGSDADVPALIDELQHATAYDARAWAAERLGYIGNDAAVPALIAALNDPIDVRGWVAANAARALARIGDVSALPAVQNAYDNYAFKDSYGYIFEAALRDLNFIANQTGGAEASPTEEELG